LLWGMASQLMLWDTEVRQTGPGRALVVLGLPDTQGGRWTLYRLARVGLIKGWKPGKVEVRRDGRWIKGC
ncbi:MAG: hypothetical protein ACQKBY_11590, partial [Verrucomicrobiales bacterium]